MPELAAERRQAAADAALQRGPEIDVGALALGVLEHLRDGVASCRMLTEAGRPVDFIYLYANAAFYTQTGLGPVVGRHASEIFPGILQSDPVMFDIYGRVAAGGAPETFERFIAALGQWFSVHVYHSAPGCFVAIFSVVTGRKQAEQRNALARVEQHAILESGIVGLVRVRNRCIVWANAAFQAAFGYKMADLAGQSTQLLFPTRQAWEQFGQASRPVIQAGQVYRAEVLQRPSDGTLRWFAVSCTRPAPDTDDVIGAFFDITERKQAEAALVRSEAQLNEAQRLARMGSWQLDLQSGVLDWSDAMYALYGRLPGQPATTPENWLCTVHPDDQGPTRLALDRAIDAETPLDLVHRVVDADGTLRQVKVHGKVTCAEDGTPLRVAGTAQDITETLRLQNGLRNSEARLRSIFDTLSEGVVFQGGDGSIVDANPAAERVLGLSRDQLLGRSSQDPRWRAVREDGTPLAGEDHPAMVALRTGQALRDRVIGVEAPTFGQRWISINSNPVQPGAGGRVESVVTTFSDITARRRLDAALAATADELRDLYDNAPCGYHSLDAEGRFLRINDTELAWLGRSREQVLGTSITEIFTPEGRATFQENYPKLRALGRVEGLEFDLAGPDGSTRRVSVSAGVVRDGDGHILRTRSVMYDISELHRVREQLRQLVHEQQAMLDTDLIGIARVRERRLVWTNRALLTMFGYESSGLVGMPTRTLYRSDAEHQALGEAAYPALTAGRAHAQQIQMQRQDGQLLWVDLRGMAFPGAHGESIWLMMDITRQRHAELTRLEEVRLQAENAQIREASRLKSLFIANMQHELRTPLNAVIGLSQLLESGAVRPDSPKYRQFLGQISTSGRHLLQLIDEVLDVAAIESGLMTFLPEPVDLGALAQEGLDVLAAEAQARQIAMHCRVEPGLDGIEIDALRLKQVIANFLSNAVKFSPSGGRVELRMLPEGPLHFHVEVENSGIGIADGDLPRLFKEFQQLRTGQTKLYPGTGLGLALTRRLVCAQGGSVGVRSRSGVGSVFHAVLPRRPAPERGEEA
jgi:PAS domain S-box-containing protein